MAKKFLTSLKLVNLPSDPSVGSEGELYFNTSASIARIYKSGEWADLDTAGGGSLSQEQVQDYVAPLFTNATNTNVIATYDDENNVINLNTSGSLISVDSITYPDYITFDTTPETIPTATGSLFWDSGDSVPAAVLNANVNVSLGQEQVALVKNATGASIAKGKVVYINGAQGQRPTITLSDADTEASSSKTFGLTAEAIADEAEGFVTTFGVLRGVNTEGLTEGAPLWLSSTAGSYTTTIPAEPAHSVFIGYVVKASVTAGEIFVNIQNGYELNELHGVVIENDGALTDNEVLAYDSSSGLWKNQNSVEAGLIDTSSTEQTKTGNLIIGGNLTVNGTTTTLNTENLIVEDNIITLNSNVTGTPTLNAGIEIERGSSDNVSLLWDESIDKWKVTSDGTNYYPISTQNGWTYAGAITIKSNNDGEGNLYFQTFANSFSLSDTSGAILTTGAGSKVFSFTNAGAITFPDATSQTTAFLGMPSYSTTNLSEGSNLYFTDERAQDATSSMIINGSHTGISVEYVDSSNILNLTNTGVRSLTGTENEILVSASVGSISIGIPDSPVFVTPNIGVATATSINETTIPSSKTLVVTTDIGSSVQAYDADLQAISALSSGNGFLKRATDNTWFLDTSSYVSTSDLSYYLTISSASSTYLTQASASSTYQPLNSNLTTISGITENGILVKTGTSTWTVITNNSTNWDTAYSDRNRWDGGPTGLDAATGRTSLGLGTMATATAADYLTLASASTTYQPLDSELTALASTTSAANALPYFTGSGTATTTTLSSFGRTLIDDADAATARTTLGLGTVATSPVTDFALLGSANAFTVGGHTITNAVAATIPLLVKGAASQSANLQEWQDSAGTVLASVSPSGNITAASFVKTSGTSSQFLKADGSVDSSTYLTTGSASTTYQPLDTELSAIAGLTSAADRLPYFTGSGTAALATFTSFGRSLVDDVSNAAARTTLGATTVGGSLFTLANPSAITFPKINADNTVTAESASTYRTSLGLAIGTNVQAYDPELSAIAGLTSAADRLPYFTGSGTAALATFTSFGRSLVDDADANAARTTLGLGTMATETAADYLTVSSASSTYLTQSSASTTYLTSYTETDTLSSVTGRGATTSNAISITNATAASSSTTGALIVTGGVGIGEDLYVDNDVYVGGNINITGTITGDLTSIDVTNLVVTDPLIYLAEGNPDDSVDIGIFAALNHGGPSYSHTGLIRDASDSGKWKLASGLADPTSNVINFTGATFDTLKIGALEVTDASTTRTNLGLAIGTNVQAYDVDLAAISALAGTTGFLKKTAADTWSLDTSTYLTSAVTSITAGTGLSGGTITSTGTIALATAYGDTTNPYGSKTANFVLASPNGSAGVPTFRALLAADIPTLSYAPNAFSTISTTSGTSPVADSTTDTLTLSAGTGISVTGDATTDTITIANTGALLSNNTFTGSQTLRAGTATAGTAPLYFTSGTNLTTAAAGAMEFDGTNLYFSPSTTRRTFAFLDSPTFTGTVTSATLSLTTADTATAASHYFVETASDGIVRPKTLANVKTEIIGNAFTTFTGPTTSAKTFTLPDASSTILTSNAAVTLTQGGTNASLTASNGGIVYSTATAMAILSGTATAGQMLRSGATGAPSWSTATFPSTATGTGTILRADGTNWAATTATYPATTTVNQILYSSSANIISGITTANSQVLVTNASGIPAFSSTLPTGTAAATAAVDTNTTAVATTAFVLAQASSSTPAANGTAAVGTSTRYARGDHAHAGGGGGVTYTASETAPVSPTVGDIWLDTTTGIEYTYVNDLAGGAGTTTWWVELAPGGYFGPPSAPTYSFSSVTTNSDPGNGVFRYNNAALSSTTQIYIDDLDSKGTVKNDWFATFDDSTSAIKGYLLINGTSTNDSAVFAINTYTSNSTYTTLDVTYVSGGSTVPSSGTVHTLVFARNGDKGDAATIAVGTVTTGSPGTSASITNAGTSNAATFNFTIPRGDVGPAANQTIPFNRSGTVLVTTGTQRFRFPADATIIGASLALNTAGSSSTTVVIKKNGSALTFASALTLGASATALAEQAISGTATVVAGDYLTVDITAAGTNASDLSVFVRYF